MEDTYESITAAAVEAIMAIVAAPATSTIFLDDSAMVVACCVYFSWADYVGGAARQEDVERIKRMIARISNA